VLILLLLVAWGLPGVAFFLDRWRLPVLGLLVTLSLVLYWVAAADHYFRVIPRSAEPPETMSLPTPEDVLETWLAGQGAEPHMVVVAASGGGILASAWTAEVLAGLEEEIGESFTRSLHLVSAVSGGSVGTMYYLDGFSRSGPRDASALKAVRDAASAPSLSAAAWGFAYPDLWRFLAAPLVQLAPLNEPHDLEERAKLVEVSPIFRSSSAENASASRMSGGVRSAE